MTLSVILALAWMLVANVKAMFPSRDNHWRFAYAMIALGLPVLGLVWVQNGFWVAVVFLLAAMWVMRWPVIYAWRWLRRRAGPRPE